MNVVAKHYLIRGIILALLLFGALWVMGNKEQIKEGFGKVPTTLPSNRSVQYENEKLKKEGF